ncbi:acyl-CoA dehydrogenase/oxidase C-terminal [Fimicolochytrium jonesii]|uniref:acyl-CoA dehydrogenase/oxidase C-terminal n=1 Tax=Fimicolochytrium jonesii TaxID=1396493 RepID=UPI0022FEBF39|nr:acyl-CoA dehydrogenase/oxidase C-terminal [Fimicolochytrium jonesii]KAI8819816.1 acyl-CoA dehydrogenase/oxidase C-terminal [Fimicolochytrium jonesii]
MSALNLKAPGPEELKAERELGTFPIRQMTYFLDGGEKQTKLKEKIMLSLERDPVWNVSDQHDLTLQQKRERSMQKVRRAAHSVASEPTAVFRKRMELISVLDPGTWTRIGVHYGLFFGALSGGATPEQLSYWAQKGAVTLNGLIGCFGMTELGHGSNVAGLETTATYDETSDEFVIHTPTLTATKWWIGGAAQTATHCVVFAQLVVKGKKYGVKNFVVPLRDTETFECFPGIVIGDIGAKMGRDGVDNGYIQFTHVRIPRSYMLMKHTKVNRRGEVKEPPLQQLTYGALIQGRVSMVIDSSSISKKALTIAIRYAAIRRQFGAKPGQPETKILDYVIHQYRLMPLLSQAFAMHFTAIEVLRMYDELMANMDSLQPGDKNLGDVLEKLKELHGTSAGLKAFSTWSTLNIIDQCRQSCGGHGYSAYTGLASLYSDFAVHCTWEGDNTILTLQGGRYLIGCYREAKAGKRQAGGVAYLNNLDTLLNKKCAAKSQEDITNLNVIEEAFWLVSGNVVKKAGEDFEDGLKRGLKDDESYEECSQARLYASKIHSLGYFFHRFKSGISRAPAELLPILERLCLLYGLYSIVENAGPFLQYGYFTPQQMDWIRASVAILCKEVRHQAIPLTDAFNYSDFMLNSPLGRYDGNAYEAYFGMVQQAHKAGAVPSYFKTETYPLLHRKLEADDVLELDEEDDE